MPSIATLFELESAHEVPDSYSWPTIRDHPTVPDPIPLIDLSDPTAAGPHLRRACESCGAFQVTAHGVGPSLLPRLESQLLRLFSLPTHQKLKAARSPGGLSGYGLVPISSFFDKLMWSEGFTISGSSADHARSLWPDDPAPFCDVMDEYDKEMKALAGRLMRLLFRSLGLDDLDFAAAGLVEKKGHELTGAVRLNSYPPCPDPDRAIGMAPHTDSSLVTLLYQNGTSGLQVLRTTESDSDSGSATWATVPPVPGSIVVILGDLFQILSNGRFRSAYHRAVVNRAQRRLSAAYFCGPPSHVTVGPVGKLVDPVRGPRYKAVTWPEYRDIKAKVFQDALDSLKVC